MRYGRLFVFILFVFISLTGCIPKSARIVSETWDSIDDLEKEANKYGTIAVGAPRVTKYDNKELAKSRDILKDAIKKIRDEFIAKPPPPEVSIEKSTETNTYFKLAIEPSLLEAFEKWINIPAGDKPDIDKLIEEVKKHFNEKFEELKKIQGNSQLEPNRVDMATLRLSALRFLESKMEDLNLSESYPVGEGYDRFQVSVSLTAWTRKPAVAALVYLDLYPFDGDLWCHKAVEKSECIDKLKEKFHETFSNAINIDEYNINEWNQKWKENKADPYGKCHLWLIEKNLVPKLVYVESLGDSRYFLDSESINTGYDAMMSFGMKKVGFKMGQSGGEDSKTNKAEIKMTSLSFAAGERRAGWFFMREGDNAMRPVEHRVRMIVDIPKNLNKLDVHVHKLFIGKDGEIINEFSKQMDELLSARNVLDNTENEINRYPNPTYWQLIKSRVRNLLSLGWSERIVIDIPKVEKKDKGPKR